MESENGVHANKKQPQDDLMWECFIIMCFVFNMG